MGALYELGFRAISLLPAEPAHSLVFGALRATMALPFAQALSRKLMVVDDPCLEVRALGTTFRGPLGLAAGFDKNAQGPGALTALGFSFLEIGTVTHQAQPGNPKPRLFRLPQDRALVNRLGFNNQGAARVRARLERDRSGAVIAVNIGKTKVVSEEDAAEDYAASARLLGAHAAFVVVNVSSPNTPGLRNLQHTEALDPILTAVRAALDQASPSRRVPLLVKIAPDLSDEQIDAIADLALARGLDGIVATNTTISRSDLRSDEASVSALGAGGLSGQPLKQRSLEVLARLYRRVGARMVLVGVGGIETGEDAWQRICHGATLLELYTGFIYQGPLVARRIHRELGERLRQCGFSHIAEAVGSAIEPARPDSVRPAHQP